MGNVTTMVRAALPAVPVVNQLPGLRKVRGPFTGLARTRTGVMATREAVDAYAAVCGFPRKDVVPLPFPHVLAFPLHLEIMGDPRFPWPGVGTVHLENSITAHRAVRVGEVLDLVVEAGPARPHDKGALVDFRAVATVDGETVWESSSTYLRRGARVDGEHTDGPAAGGLQLPDAPDGGIVWRLPGDLGRRYAAVSGDHNPIHLHPLTARALGFPRQIAHGMWTMARSVAAVENRLPEACTVEVAFKKPVLLPGEVRFSHAATAQGEHHVALVRPRDGAPHLLGRILPA